MAQSIIFLNSNYVGRHCLHVNEEISDCSPWNSDLLDNVQLNLIRGHFLFFKQPIKDMASRLLGIVGNIQNFFLLEGQLSY